MVSTHVMSSLGWLLGTLLSSGEDCGLMSTVFRVKHWQNWAWMWKYSRRRRDRFQLMKYPLANSHLKKSGIPHFSTFHKLPKHDFSYFKAKLLHASARKICLKLFLDCILHYTLPMQLICLGLNYIFAIFVMVLIWPLHVHMLFLTLTFSMCLQSHLQIIFFSEIYFSINVLIKT